MLRTVIIYGVALALAAIGLQWLEYLTWARVHAGAVYVALIAAAFLGLGVWVGAKAFRPAPAGGPFAPNTRAIASLGITPREYEVLALLAAGGSNKEIARRLKVSPNTVKTHASNLYQKLGSPRRTSAVSRARELGLIA